MISSAYDCPITRLPSSFCKFKIVAISSFIILPAGMPVQPEITSPTICASTQTRMSPLSPCRADNSDSRARSCARSSAGLNSGAAVATPPVDSATAADPFPPPMAAAGAGAFALAAALVDPLESPSSFVRISRIFETSSPSWAKRSFSFSSTASVSARSWAMEVSRSAWSAPVVTSRVSTRS